MNTSTPPLTAGLKDKTLLITGASRGIGLAIAKRAAADGANIVILAKTTDPNPKLPGTIFSAAKEGGLQPVRAFASLYAAFLGRSNGPRAGWLLAALDPALVVTRLRAAAAIE